MTQVRRYWPIDFANPKGPVHPHTDGWAFSRSRADRISSCQVVPGRILGSPGILVSGHISGQ